MQRLEFEIDSGEILRYEIHENSDGSVSYLEQEKIYHISGKRRKPVLDAIRNAVIDAGEKSIVGISADNIDQIARRIFMKFRMGLNYKCVVNLGGGAIDRFVAATSDV
jgi:hypothetical protein